jgi:hypothetical protein
MGAGGSVGTVGSLATSGAGGVTAGIWASTMVLGARVAFFSVTSTGTLEVKSAFDFCTGEEVEGRLRK